MATESTNLCRKLTLANSSECLNTVLGGRETVRIVQPVSEAVNPAELEALY